MPIVFDRPSIVMRVLNYYVTKLQNTLEDEDLRLSDFELIENDLQLEIDNASEVIKELEARREEAKHKANPFQSHGYDDYRHLLCRALRIYLHFLKNVKEGIDEGLEVVSIPMRNVQQEIELLEKEHIPDICSEQKLSQSADPTDIGERYQAKIKTRDNS